MEPEKNEQGQEGCETIVKGCAGQLRAKLTVYETCVCFPCVYNSFLHPNQIFNSKMFQFVVAAAAAACQRTAKSLYSFAFHLNWLSACSSNFAQPKAMKTIRQEEVTKIGSVADTRLEETAVVIRAESGQ